MIRIKTKVFLAFFFLSFIFIFFDHIQAVSCLKSDNTCVQLEDDAETDDCDGVFYDDSEVCGSCWINDQCDVEEYKQSQCLSQNGLWANTSDCDGREAAALQGQTDLTNVVPSVNCYFPVSNNTQFTSLNNFGSAQENGSSCHSGVDIDLTSGNQEIIAATTGVVYQVIGNYSTCSAASGLRVGGQASALVVEDDGIFYLYGGLDPNSFSLQSGDQISTGQTLGTSKNCGQLHFEVRSDADFSQFWYPPAGKTVGSAANYCRQNFSGTKPINLIDPTDILTNFSQNKCLVVANNVDSTAGDHWDLSNVYVKNNIFASWQDLNRFIAQLIYDGNQAYCAAPATILSGFTHSKYKAMKLDLTNATIPLMRNSNYQPFRRNSAETYYGYIADTQNKGITSEANLLTETSWLGKTLNAETRCTMKVYNQLYLSYEYQKCLNVAIATCIKPPYLIGSPDPYAPKNDKEKKCLSLAKERCMKLHVYMDSDFYTKKIWMDLQEKKVNLLPSFISNFKANRLRNDQQYLLKGKNEIISVTTYCQNLLKSTAANDLIIKDGLEKFPLFLPTIYRTGYIVQAIKICPVRKTGDCGDPVWDYNNCEWSIVPDRIRVYPFKFPDLATNKNYCDQDSPQYPEKCIVYEDLPSFDPITNYSDPATLNAQFLQTFTEQEQDRTESVAARTQMVSLAQNATYDSGDFVYCYNCKQNLAQALIKIINATNANNKFNISYLGENASNMDCSGSINSGETSAQITTSALHSLKEEGPTAYEAPIAGAAGSFKESCCLKRERVVAPDGTVSYPCVSTAYAKAKVRYWVVSPQGEQLKMIEEQILGTFYQADKAKSNSSTTNFSQTITSAASSTVTASSIDYSSRSLKKVNYNGMNYWIYKPQTDVSGLPLIVFLHGAGLGGTDSPGLTKIIADGVNYPAVIIAPQASGNWKNSVLTKVKSIIDKTVTENNLNVNKISVTGHSMGGRGVYHLISAYPSFFSAGAPISAINAQSDPMTDLNYSALAQIPFRSYVGRGESYAEKPRIDKINAVGGKATLTVLENANHTETPAEIYPSNKTDLIQWLINQTNNSSSSTTPSTSTSTLSTSTQQTDEKGTYKAFIKNDKRQNKYLSLQNILTKDGNSPNLNILGAGPITNIFIVQQSLYTKNSGLYQTLAKYKDINAYLTDIFNTGSGSIYTACGNITPVSDPYHDTYLKSFLPPAYYKIMMTPVEQLNDSMLEAACPSVSGRVYSSKARAGKMVRYYDEQPLWSSKTKTPTYGNNSQLSRKKIEDCIYTIFNDPKLVINMMDCESFTIANNVGFGSNSKGCYAAGLLQIKPFEETHMANYSECSSYNNYPSLSSLTCKAQASIARLNLPLYNLAIAKAVATKDGTRNEKFNTWACYWHVINGTSGTII